MYSDKTQNYCLIAPIDAKPLTLLEMLKFHLTINVVH